MSQPSVTVHQNNGRVPHSNPVFDSSDTFRMACRQLEQVADVDAEELRVFRIFRSPYVRKKLTVGDHAVGVLGEEAEDVVFQGGELDFAAVPFYQATRLGRLHRLG